MNGIALVFLGCCIISPLAFAQSSGDSAAGKKLAEKWQCTLCHGPDGNGNKVSTRTEMSEAWSTPRISAQPQRYFIKTMQDYKTGKRSNDDMELMAKQLSEDEIRDLAAWYGSQTPRAHATYDFDPER